MYTGDLVRLCEYSREDSARALTFINNPEVLRLIQTGVRLPRTYKEEEKWIENMNAGKLEGYTFKIETLKDSLYIGGCGVNELDWKNRNAVVGIMVGDPVYWGHGYGTDAMRVLVRFLFDQVGLNRIALKVFDYNERAIKSYQKVGFTQEGRMRETLYCDGAFHDEIVMSILKREYDALYERKY